jgi:hypothetical protein
MSRYNTKVLILSSTNIYNLTHKMNVNKETNRRMKKVSIAGIISMFIFSFVKINSDPLLYSLLDIVAGVISIYLLLYLISILQFAHEAVSVQNPFSIFLGLEVVRLIGLFFAESAASLLSGIGIIELIIMIYILIATFKIKSDKFARPFRIFGVLLMLTTAAKILLLFGFMLRNNGPISLYINLMTMLPLLAIFYIIHQTGKYLQNIQTTVIS